MVQNTSKSSFCGKTLERYAFVANFSKDGLYGELWLRSAFVAIFVKETPLLWTLFNKWLCGNLYEENTFVTNSI